MPTPAICFLVKPADIMLASISRARAEINLIRLEAKGFVAKLFLTITCPEGPTTPNLILVPPTSTPTTYFFIHILAILGNFGEFSIVIPAPAPRLQWGKAGI